MSEHSLEAPQIQKNGLLTTLKIHVYAQRAFFCRFNRFWPTASALREWAFQNWTQTLDLLFSLKIILYSSSKILQTDIGFFTRVPGFVVVQDSIQPCFPEFNPLTIKTWATPVCVKLPNLPLQWIRLDFLPVIGNVLGRFVKIDSDRIANGFILFVHIYVELGLGAGLSDKIILKWDGKELH